MASNHWLFTKLNNNTNQYLNILSHADNRDCKILTRIEPRTREEDFAEALSFKIHDPLWLLTRQWQFGRFKGNDCGTAVTTKVKVSKKRLNSIYLNNDKNNKKDYTTNTPMEYDVEKRNHEITPFIRIESAIHFKKMLENNFVSHGSFEKVSDELKKQSNEIIKKLIKTFPLEPFIPFVDEKDKSIETLKIEQNTNLNRLYASYAKRTFDGYKLFVAIKENSNNILNKSLIHILEEYKKWFIKKYLPIQNEEDNCWNERKMGYQTAMAASNSVYEVEDYHTGKLSWYSFDGVSEDLKNDKKEEKLLSYLPVFAHFPGAPNKRLWQFEDGRVQFGNRSDSSFSLLANAVIMQYTSMYSNDWMLTPIEAEVGTVLDVEGIIVTDTFGERIFINTSAEETDNNKPDVEFSDRWSLFGTTKSNAYQENDFSSQKGLLFPPTIPRCDNSKPIEEVQFLRDEMANMLWGVETLINDGCGGTLNGQELSNAVLAIIDALKDENLEIENESEYYYLLQNRVPLHWIPFLPQKITGEVRDILFRRGRMPIYYNGYYNSVRPSTQLLKIKKEETGVANKATSKVKPMLINEEEVIGYGVKLSLSAQRTRWFLGDSFNWIGAQKTISQNQINSGLMFDELIEKEDNKSIDLKRQNE